VGSVEADDERQITVADDWQLQRLAHSSSTNTAAPCPCHSSNEPGELSQWLCHDDSTINTVLVIIIIIIWQGVCVCVYDNLKIIADICFLLGSYIHWEKSWISLHVKVTGKYHFQRVIL